MHLQSDMVRTIVSRYGATSVRAGQFFVSWNSVVTLAYKGFSRTLLALKRGLDEGISGLTPENDGSKWPKTTIGCLHDGVVLSEKQVHDLRRACEEHNNKLRKEQKRDRSLEITGLTCVTFHCRTLERRLTSDFIPLGGKAAVDDKPPTPHLQDVAKTMAQFNQEEHAHYFPKMTPEGRTIDAYYRAPHVEATLVYDLTLSAALHDAITDFRQAVDEILPDCYAWFDPNSWHMTVRALVAKA